jgi:hypothetical protein
MRQPNDTPARPAPDSPAPDLRARLDREFNALATDILAPLIDLLIVSRRYFAGDVDKFLLMLVVGVRTSADPRFLDLSEAERSDGDTSLPGLGTNVRSMAASLDMPRESVRRKVAEMIDAGWLAWEDRKLHLTARAYRELAPVREALKRLTLTNYKALSPLLSAGCKKTQRDEGEGEAS